MRCFDMCIVYHVLYHPRFILAGETAAALLVGASLCVHFRALSVSISPVPGQLLLPSLQLTYHYLSSGQSPPNVDRTPAS
jgi:hypothetical protein